MVLFGRSGVLKRSVKFLFIVAACLILSSPFWIFQVSGTVSSTIQTVDASGKMGSYLCLALDSKGNPGISYYDFSNNDLKYAHWNGVNWDVQTVEADGFTGLHTALAFDSMDNPHISYDGQNALKYAYWTGTAWNIQTVDVAGSFTSIAIDANGYPHISYFSVQNGADLKYAVWTGSSWSIQTIDSDGLVGEFTSLKLDSVGYPHISYWDITNGDLKVAWQDDAGWHSQVVDSAGNVGDFTSLALDANGNTHISYFDNASRDLKYAESNGSDWNIQVVDSNGDVGTDTSLALDSSGNPHISYTDNTNHVLKYASWNDSTWNIISLRSAGYVGEYTSLPNDQTSLKIDKDDNARIAYCDWGNYWLKYATAPDPSGLAAKYVQPIASLNVSPNPVGVGQTVSINMSLLPKPPTVSDRFSNITLLMTNPDGTSCNLGPFFSEPTGFVNACYVPTQVGNYSLKVTYSGQFFPSNNATYWPTQSNVATLNVQQQPAPIPSPSPSPTPTLSPTSSPTVTPKENTQTTNMQANQQTSNEVPPNLNNEPDGETTHLTADSGNTENQQPQSVYAAPEPDSTASIAIFTVIAVPICLGLLIYSKRR